MSTLPDPAMVTAADVVVGFATYNDAPRVAQAVEAITAGCGAFAGTAACAIVHVDGASTDGTVARAAEAAGPSVPLLQSAYALEAVDRLSGPYRGVPAKGNAVRAVFDTARRLGARACVIVDVDVERFDRGWLEALVRPVVTQQVDLVMPRYALRRFAGTINSGVAYPLTRALYGRRVRYPMGGDFACSQRFVERLAGDPEWDTDIARSTVDLWLTTRALTDGSRLAQAQVGAKRQAWRDLGVDVTGPLVRVLAALFHGADRWQAVWQKVRGSTAVDQFEADRDLVDDTPMNVDVRQGIEAFRFAQKHLNEIWRLVLPPRTLLELKRLAQAPDDAFRMPDDVWARVTYDFTLAYHQRTLGREHVLTAFVPLFSAWVSSFMAGLADTAPSAFEDRLEELCLRFEGEKPYLISRWRWPDRFSP